MTIPLEYRNMPANLEMAGDMVNRIEVGLRAPRGMISSVTPDQVRAHIDLSRSPQGLNYIQLTGENIQAPLGAEVIKIRPSAVRIKLDQVNNRLIPVRTNFVGKLSGSLRLKSVLIEPSALMLQGSENTLAKLNEIVTEPIDLSRIHGSEKIQTGVAINLPTVHLAPNQPSKVIVEVTVEKAG